MVNAYISAAEYLNRITGLSTSALVGNLARTGTVALGATSLTVSPALTVALQQWDNLTLFDGANSEVVTVASGGAAINATTIPISATQYAHSAGTSCCSDGASGSLAEAIIEGSASLESITRQALLQATVTLEMLPMPTTRAWVDSSRQLTIRPRQFPVQSVSAVNVLYGTATLNLDVSTAMIDSIGRMVTFPTISTTGGGNTLPFSGGGLAQETDGFIQMTYVAGYTYSALPSIIKRACTLLVSDILADVFNPTGAASVQMGKRNVAQYLRGDLSGESALVKQARHWLRPYTQDAL